MSIFVSYSSRNIEHVGFLDSENLNEGRHKLWIAYQKNKTKNQKNVPPGEKFEKEIIKAIRESKGAILFVSNDYLNAEFVINQELPEIFKKREADKSYKIIPILVEPILDYSKCPELENLQFVNSPNTYLNKLTGNSYRLVLRDALQELGVIKEFSTNIFRNFSKLRKYFIPVLLAGIIAFSYSYFQNDSALDINNVDQTLDKNEANNQLLLSDSIIAIKDTPKLGCINFQKDSLEKNKSLIETDPFSLEVFSTDCDSEHDAQFLGKITFRNLPGGEIDTFSSVYGFYYEDPSDEKNMNVVDVNGAAKAAGLMDGDKIVAINNEYISYAMQIPQIISRNKANSKTLFTIQRAGEYLNIPITPNKRSIPNDPDKILEYSIDICSSTTGDFMWQEGMNEHFEKITSSNAQYFSIPFVDFQSQKYYSEFYVYCFIVISGDGFEIEENFFNRTGTYKLINSINEQKKGSIYLNSLNVYSFNEIPESSINLKNFSEVIQGECLDNATDSISNNEKFSNGFVEKDMFVSIIDCSNSYGQILTSYEISLSDLLEEPGTKDFNAKIKNQCQDLVSDFTHIPTVAKYYSIGGIISLDDEDLIKAEKENIFTNSIIFQPIYFYSDESNQTIKILCEMNILVPNTDSNLNFKLKYIDNIFSNRTVLNEINNLSVDYCPSLVPFGYFYYDYKEKSLPTFYEKIKIPITWDSTDDFKIESISWGVQGSIETDGIEYESESLYLYADENSPYKSIGSKSYVIEIDTTGRNYDNYFKYDNDGINILIRVNTTTEETFHLECMSTIKHYPFAEEISLNKSVNEGYKTVEKLKNKKQFLSYLDPSELDYPFLPKLITLFFEENLNANLYDIGIGFYSYYDVVNYTINFTLCEYPEITPCKNKTLYGYPGLSTSGSLGIDKELNSDIKTVLNDSENIKGGLGFGFTTGPYEKVTFSIDESCDWGGEFFSLSGQNIDMNCFENNNPDEIYAVLNLIDVTFSGNIDEYGEFVCDVSYEFFENNNLNGSNLNKDKPALPRIIWGQSKELTDGENLLERNCNLLERTGLGLYETGYFSTSQKQYYFPNYDAQNIWDGEYLGEIPKIIIYKK